MHKKTLLAIIILVGTLIVVVAVSAGFYFFGSNPDQMTVQTKTNDVVTDPKKQETDITPDLSIDLKACSVLTKQQIEKELQPTITVVADAYNRGIADTGRGIKAQSCVYVFNNATEVNDRLTVTVTKYPSDNEKNAALSGFKNADNNTALQNQTTLTGIGDAAFYGTTLNTVDLEMNAYTVHVFKSDSQYTIGLSRPIKTDTFTVESAKTVLGDLAKQLRI